MLALLFTKILYRVMTRQCRNMVRFCARLKIPIVHQISSIMHCVVPNVKHSREKNSHLPTQIPSLFHHLWTSMLHIEEINTCSPMLPIWYTDARTYRTHHYTEILACQNPCKHTPQHWIITWLSQTNETMHVPYLALDCYGITLRPSSQLALGTWPRLCINKGCKCALK